MMEFVISVAPHEEAPSAPEPVTLSDFVVNVEPEMAEPTPEVRLSDFVVSAAPEPEPSPARAAPEPEPSPARAEGRAGRATVGGAEYAVGGWGEYEINRRRASWEAGRGAGEKAGARYPGRTYVDAHTAASSVLAGARGRVGGGAERAKSPATALQRAAERLADALGPLEDRLCDPDDSGVWECVPAAALRPHGSRAMQALSVPPITSADLRELAEGAAPSDPDALYDLGEDVTALVAAATGTVLRPPPQLAGRKALPPLPSRLVPISDEESVLRLEAATAPYVASVEALEAALATHLDRAATALGRAERT